MATAEFSAAANALVASARSNNLVTKTITDAGAADTALATVVTDQTTAFTDFNTFAAALIAITSDTFNTSTHQFTFGGSTGLTHAQWATLGAQLNTAMTAFVTAQTDTTTAKTATALAKTDVTNINQDMTVYIGSISNIASMDVLEQCWRRIKGIIMGSNLLTAGSGTPRVP